MTETTGYRPGLLCIFFRLDSQLVAFCTELLSLSVSQSSTVTTPRQLCCVSSVGGIFLNSVEVEFLFFFLIFSLKAEFYHTKEEHLKEYTWEELYTNLYITVILCVRGFFFGP